MAIFILTFIPFVLADCV